MQDHPPVAQRLRPGDELLVAIQGMASDGRGTSSSEGRVFKVEGAIPGETVRARVFGRDKRVTLARAVAAEAPSPHRVEPRCRHFGECGGCSWQHIDYQHQLQLKRQLLLDALAERGLDHPPVPLPLGVREPWFYRNKMDFDFAPGPAGPMLGLHRRGSYRTLLDLQECFLQSPSTGPMLATVRRLAVQAGLDAYDLKTHQGALRNLLVLEGKASGRFLIQLVTSGPAVGLQGLAEELMRQHPEIDGVLHAVHEGRANLGNPEGASTVLCGAPSVPETIAGITLEVGPHTFLQRNTEQAALLYATVLDLARPPEGAGGPPLADVDAVDLFCGFGPISQLLAPHVRSVTGIEVVADMIHEAERLSAERGVHNTRFMLGSAEDLLPRLAQELRPQLVVANPPRAGIHKKALRALVELQAPRLVYVSCAPATLADNLKVLLQGGYVLERLQPVDLFPQTPHLETVAALTCRPSSVASTSP